MNFDHLAMETHRRFCKVAQSGHDGAVGVRLRCTARTCEGDRDRIFDRDRMFEYGDIQNNGTDIHINFRRADRNRSGFESWHLQDDFVAVRR